MNWLLIAIIAYFIYAIVFIADRVLVTKAFKEPVTYTFYSGLLHGSTILLIPLILLLTSQSVWPASYVDLLISLLAGFVYFVAVFFFYRALSRYDTSGIVPLVGSLIPVFSLIFTVLFLSVILNGFEYIAFGLLILGGLIISLKKQAIKTSKMLIAGLLAALFFGIFYTLTEYIYDTQEFWSGFIFARVGTALTAVLVLVIPQVRKIIFKSSKKVEHKLQVGGAIVFFHGLAAIGFVMVHQAIFLSHASLVNALQGVQYVFLLLLTIFLSRKFPQLLKEDFTEGKMIKRVGGILLIIIGLAIIAFYSL